MKRPPHAAVSTLKCSLRSASGVAGKGGGGGLGIGAMGEGECGGNLGKGLGGDGNVKLTKGGDADTTPSEDARLLVFARTIMTVVPASNNVIATMDVITKIGSNP